MKRITVAAVSICVWLFVGNSFASEGLKFRKAIYLRNPAKQALFNYQVKIKIGQSAKARGYDLHCAGKAQAHFRDIQFRDAGGEKKLSYFLEKIRGANSAELGVVWVKVPYLPVEGAVIYLYYGDPEAVSHSDPNGVFDFFDTFNQKELDKKVWSVKADKGGSVKTIDSRLIISAAKVLSKEFKFKDGIIEYSAKALEGKEISFIIKEAKSLKQANETRTQAAYASAYKGAEHCIVVDDIVKVNFPRAIAQDIKYGFRVSLSSGQVVFERFDKDFDQLQALTKFTVFRWLGQGSLGFKAKKSVEFDWIRLRKGVLAGVEGEPGVDKSKTIHSAEENMGEKPQATGRK